MRNYYVAANGNDSADGSQGAPFKTIGKVNSLSLVAGDKVLFNSGDIFYGNLIIKNSGVSGNPIYYGAYGTGAKPIITGFTVQTLTQVGNLYTSNVQTNMVLMDGVFQAYGSTDYFTVSSAGTNSITGTFNVPNCVGGEVVWRPKHWVLWRGTITQQTSNTITYSAFPSSSGGPVYPAVKGYGFFFQNHPSLCTAAGQWACNAGKLSINLDNPNRIVKAATIADLITASGKSFVTFEGISFQGANNDLVNLISCSNFTFNNCEILYGGLYGIFGNGTSPNLTVTNCEIGWILSNAIFASSGSSTWTIVDNKIHDIGFVAGMGGSGEGQYFVIRDVKNSKVTGNKITKFGYVGINFQGQNNLIDKNYLDTFGTVKDDGSGIYCGGQNNTGTKITNNIVLNGLGASKGTPDSDNRMHGIYVDDGASNIEIANNTIAYCGGGGIYLHNAHEINIHDNICFDNKTSQITYYNDGNTIGGISLNNNIFFAKSSSEFVHRSSGGSASPKDFFSQADNNFWCRPSNENGSFSSLVPSRSDNLGTWKSFTGKEANSKITPAGGANAILSYNETDAVKSFPTGYVDLFGTETAIQPFSGNVVIPGTAPVPTIFKNVAQSKSFTRNNCTGGATGSAVVYAVPAGKYTSTVSQAAADQLAIDDVNNNGQNYANLNGTCTPPVKTITKVVIYYSDGSTVTQV